MTAQEAAMAVFAAVRKGVLKCKACQGFGYLLAAPATAVPASERRDCPTCKPKAIASCPTKATLIVGPEYDCATTFIVELGWTRQSAETVERGLAAVFRKHGYPLSVYRNLHTERDAVRLAKKAFHAGKAAALLPQSAEC